MTCMCVYNYWYAKILWVLVLLFLLFDQHPNRKLRVIIVVYIYTVFTFWPASKQKTASHYCCIYRYILFLLFDQHPNRKLPVIIVINIFILHGSIYNDQSTWISYTYILGVSWYFSIQRLCVNKTKFLSI